MPASKASSPGHDELARARLSFLNGEPVPSGVVRRPIFASWTRARLMDVRPDNLELSYGADADGESLLARAAEPVLRGIADLFATEPVSVILCDADGVVLSRRTGDRSLEQHLDRVWLAPGFSYAEQFVGTNGIGTALESRGPAQVFGHEHYVDRLEELACAGVPIRNPATGKVVGVIDLTCWRRDAGSLLVATAATLNSRIEQSLLGQSGQRERAVLDDYLAACRRNRGPVLAIGDNLLMMNDRAREQLEPADQALLVAESSEAMSAGRRHPLVLDLPSGRTVRVHCRPTVRGNGVVGGVLDVAIVATAPASGPPAIPVPRRSSGRGTGAWSKCSGAVERHLAAREWLVLEGEPGAGRTTVARMAHENHAPASLLHVVRAEEQHLDLAVIAEELQAGIGSLVLADVDRLSAEAGRRLVDVLEPYRESTHPDRPWVVATVGPGAGDRSPWLEELLLLFPRTVTVPPLRHHLEDIADLAPALLARLSHGAGLTLSPDALRVLMHNRWPGNVAQLLSVLRKVVAKRRSGVIEVQDLPPECRSTSRRTLTPLEALECDAIVEALQDSAGSKVEAARRLAMSRATIYRKIRDYGISVPAVTAGAAEAGV